MHFNDLIPGLSVSDIAQAKTFYSGILGFDIVYERPENELCFLEQGRAQIMLEEKNGYWETWNLEYPLGRGINFEIGIDDILPIYERLKAAKVALYQDLEIVKYRINDEFVQDKQFLVQDPDGYLLRFSMER
jgi:catechol 2,3-dioxygenase-like lactoylglutathione lyase family enzyme